MGEVIVVGLATDVVADTPICIIINDDVFVVAVAVIPIYKTPLCC